MATRFHDYKDISLEDRRIMYDYTVNNFPPFSKGGVHSLSNILSAQNAPTPNEVMSAVEDWVKRNEDPKSQVGRQTLKDGFVLASRLNDFHRLWNWQNIRLSAEQAVFHLADSPTNRKFSPDEASIIDKTLGGTLEERLKNAKIIERNVRRMFDEHGGFHPPDNWIDMAMDELHLIAKDYSRYVETRKTMSFSMNKPF